jgi:ASC-1-like (ASCH) protein
MATKKLIKRKHTANKTKKIDIGLNKFTPKVIPTMNTHLSEPWFSLIATGLKTVEGRINKGKFAGLAIGDIITFYNDDFNHREISVKVTRKTSYPNFKAYLETETLANTVPGQPTIEHGLAVYYKYYTKEQEREYGIIAIGIEVM